MNTTIARRLLVAVAALLATAGLTFGTAGAAHAATGQSYEGAVSINSYYGWASGWAYIPVGSQDSVSFYVKFRDNRTDNVCSVLHGRGVLGNGSVTAWKKLGTSCDTVNTSWGQSFSYAPYGQYFVNAQIRVCQSDRYGNVIGTCSAAVAPQSWRVITYSY